MKLASLNGEDLDGLIKNSSHTMEETFVGCVIESVKKNCRNMLDIVATDAGNTKCLSFKVNLSVPF